MCVKLLGLLVSISSHLSRFRETQMHYWVRMQQSVKKENKKKIFAIIALVTIYKFIMIRNDFNSCI